MAPPPAYLIFRKVAKNYVRSIMTYRLRDTEILAKKINEASRIFGENSEQYKTLLMEYRRVEHIESKYPGFVYRQRMHKAAMMLLSSPKRKNEDRHGKELFNYHYKKFDLHDIS